VLVVQACTFANIDPVVVHWSHQHLLLFQLITNMP